MIRNSDTVTIDEIMTRSIITAGPETDVSEIAQLLTDHNISGVPIVDADGEPVGVVTELDVISRSGKTAAEIMSKDVISVTEDTAAEEVVEVLRSRRVRRVPVLRDGQIIGIVSRSDLLRLFSVTRWTCTGCGYFERGLQRPERCSQCGGTSFTLDREPPGM